MPMTKDRNGLNARYRRFIEEYLIDANATAAYKRAGFVAKGNSASVNAGKLLRNTHVATEIDRRQKQIAELSNVTRDRFHRELARIGFSDVTTFARVKGNRVRIESTDNLTADDSAAIAELSQTAEGVKIKLHNKIEALRTLGQALGYIKPDGSFTGNINVNLGIARESDIKAALAELSKDEKVRKEILTIFAAPVGKS